MYGHPGPHAKKPDRPTYCNTAGCAEFADRGDHCLIHYTIRVQTLESHEQEGHSHPIKNCPLCERLFKLDDGVGTPLLEWKAPPRVWSDEQCPQRGPGLTHMMNGPRDGSTCEHCGATVVDAELRNL